VWRLPPYEDARLVGPARPILVAYCKRALVAIAEGALVPLARPAEEGAAEAEAQGLTAAGGISIAAVGVVDEPTVVASGAANVAAEIARAALRASEDVLERLLPGLAPRMAAWHVVEVEWRGQPTFWQLVAKPAHHGINGSPATWSRNKRSAGGSDALGGRMIVCVCQCALCGGCAVRGAGGGAGEERASP